MAESIGSFTVDDGVHAYGVHKQVTFEGDQVVTKLTYDAEPFLRRAAELRAITAGDRWKEGIGTKVGEIPMAVMNQALALHGEERQKFLHNWLRENPAFVTFDKFLKK